jgi:glutathione S-transferase
MCESRTHHTSTDINPKGLIPAIEYRGKALYKLLILCKSAYPNHKSHLYPTPLHWLDSNNPNMMI